MKILYWRPSRISRLELIIIAGIAVVCLFATEHLLTTHKLPHHGDKVSAVHLTQRAFESVRAERMQRGGPPIDPASDPAHTGLIGQALSAVTTSSGDLAAKQTSLNANFAALLVDYFKAAQVRPGDVVAVGMSGSFPALNMATLAALQVLQARVLLIVSAGASQWGANDPNFMWPDMLQGLLERKIFNAAQVTVLAGSRGGIEDRGLALGTQNLAALDAALQRNHMPQLHSKSLADSLAQRLALYDAAAAGSPVKAYVNVGGGATSVGTHIGKHVFAPGLTLKLKDGMPLVDSVMQRFAARGVPVVHLSGILHLAQRVHLPLAPKILPPLATGPLFEAPAYSRPLAAVALGIIVATMVGFLRLDLGRRLRRGAG
jgi:poly-gamma-glutamate system protein